MTIRAACLRSGLELLLDLSTLNPTLNPTLERTLPMQARVVPYLTVHDGSAALRFYADAFGAREIQRVAMENGRLGHAEFQINGATLYLSDEFAEMGVVSPRTLGGTPVALHLTLDDVDAAFASAIAAGATSQMEPADQPHGARHGSLIDPFGHRWMLSQQVEEVSDEAYADRLAGAGMTVMTADDRPASGSSSGGIWAALNFVDALAGIRFMTEVLGFEADLVVPEDDPTKVAHSRLCWPEGGIVQAASGNRPGNVFSQRPTGGESLYVITADPMAVYERCVAAGVEVIHGPSQPDYDPGGVEFSIRDAEGNIFSFGTYTGAG